MALDACCTTRHWLSYVASAWLAYWFLLPQTSPYPTLLVWLWTLKGLKLPRNGSAAAHSSQRIECFVTFFVLLLCCCLCFMAPHLGALFLIVEWKLGYFSNMPALRISPLSWKAAGLFHHRCSAVLNGGHVTHFARCMFDIFFPCFLFCLCGCTPPVFGVNMQCMLLL